MKILNQNFSTITFNDIVTHCGEKYTAGILIGFVENQLYVHTSKFKTSKNKKLLNRHGILHGYYFGYANVTGHSSVL